MSDSKVIHYFNNQPSFQRISQGVQDRDIQLVTGLAGSARSIQLLNLLEETQKPILVIEPNLHQANQLFESLTGFLNPDNLHLFSADDSIQMELAISSPEIHGERVEALNFLLSNEPGIVIVPLAGVKRFLPPSRYFSDAALRFDYETEVDTALLPEKLTALGYTRQKMVFSPGEFSIRGGIVDIYAVNSAYPVRIELFDVEVDSIRYFDIESQRSIENIDAVTILPGRENFFLKEWKIEAADKIKQELESQVSQIKNEEVKENLQTEMTELIRALKDDDYYEGVELFASYIYPEETTIIDYLTSDGLLVLDEYPRIVEAERNLNDENDLWVEDKIEEGSFLPQQKFSPTFRDAVSKHEGAMIYYSIFEKGMGNLRLDRVQHFQYRSMQQFYSQMELLHAEVHRWLKQEYAVAITVSEEDRIAEVAKILAEYEIDHQILTKEEKITTGRVQIIQSSIRSGFEMPEEKIALITEKELFNRIPKKKVRRIQYSNAEKLKNYNELKPGDYVVHINHGIGHYIGIETMDINGIHQDYMVIVYRDEAKVFVPVDQINMVQKYVGSEGKAPRIHKLGGTEWTKTKQKVRQQVEDISDELIELYSAREAEKGHAFQVDNAYQKEFEDAFPYIETEDQLKSAEEIKRDMEKERPMDRLLIGDVGYGKTEVAMRAIFKSVQEGKQAAFLVPTTVLAQQHYQSALERFEGFPVEIGLLSRFRSKKQQEETIKGLKRGQVDLVIGTHRLLSQDVDFKDLGLLVVDEEQRFGVKHKERLKSLKKNVDVLTLTATPIPRTLHMSIIGVRDLSVIETPPSNRYPVQTYVMELNPGAVRQAIEREMARGGQVFYLHNRVATIQQRAAYLQELLPDARIAYAHGQMTEAALEEVLIRFYEGEYDVLVTTTIIETGVDLPNVNTLIVEDSDRMGLSQLYQLRGRVGRSSRVAYAYLTYEPNKVLREESVQRLQALKEFSELGAGFKIAMRDLSIRGAGDLLGKQQSGFIDSVGYDMYTQLLTEAVARKQNEPVQEKTNLEMVLDVNAYLPETYISDDFQKIDMYQRINMMKTEEDYLLIQEDMIDRFGDYPQEAADLLTIGQIKRYGEIALIEKIKQDKHRRGQVIRVHFSASGTQKIPGPEIFRALQDIPVKVDVGKKNGKIYVDFFVNKKTSDQVWLDYLLTFVRRMADFQEKEYGLEEANSSPDEAEVES
ncbi:MAG: transcription-repair coupling factor [Atopococcus tabaci]|uniref:Transcription-repair-coupling factor n=1 Tax=Atopococcus tabaci TaxID=269774 RepID=A0AA43UBY5_9LACT|nr:transcription-repair coupling factor [Atopococcus tabaci]